MMDLMTDFKPTLEIAFGATSGNFVEKIRLFSGAKILCAKPYLVATDSII